MTLYFKPTCSPIKQIHPSADYEELSDEELPVTEEGGGEKKGEERREEQGAEEEEEAVPAWIFVSVNYDPYSFRLTLSIIWSLYLAIGAMSRLHCFTLVQSILSRFVMIRTNKLSPRKLNELKMVPTFITIPKHSIIWLFLS